MRARVDEDLCTGCAVCEDMCPEVFQVGDDDLAHIISEEECEEHDLRDVAAECPNEAIIVEED
ncbi:MAG: ferredoxin [Candidatus Geothermincolia bacterium]